MPAEKPNVFNIPASAPFLAVLIDALRAGSRSPLAGIAPCFYINAASYIAVLIALWMMRADQLYPAPLVARTRGRSLDIRRLLQRFYRGGQADKIRLATAC